MIKRVDRKTLDRLPKAAESGGLLLCPLCWRPLAEPLTGKASAAVYCRHCGRHILITINKESH